MLSLYSPVDLLCVINESLKRLQGSPWAFSMCGDHPLQLSQERTLATGVASGSKQNSGCWSPLQLQHDTGTHLALPLKGPLLYIHIPHTVPQVKILLTPCFWILTWGQKFLKTPGWVNYVKLFYMSGEPSLYWAHKSYIKCVRTAHAHSWLVVHSLHLSAGTSALHYYPHGGRGWLREWPPCGYKGRSQPCTPHRIKQVTRPLLILKEQQVSTVLPWF